jgi:hypothetical protein
VSIGVERAAKRKGDHHHHGIAAAEGRVKVCRRFVFLRSF